MAPPQNGGCPTPVSPSALGLKKACDQESPTSEGSPTLVTLQTLQRTAGRDVWEQVAGVRVCLCWGILRGPVGGRALESFESASWTGRSWKTCLRQRGHGPPELLCRRP